MKFAHLSLLTSSLLASTSYTQALTSTFWNNYPACERQCHQDVYGNQSCTLQNNCGCSGCLCLANSCLCETSSWLIAVSKCIGQECGASAVREGAGIASSACAGNGHPLVVSEQSLINEGLAAIPSTISPVPLTSTSEISTSAPGTSTSPTSGTSTSSPTSGTSTSTSTSAPETSIPSASKRSGLSTAVIVVISVFSVIFLALLIGAFLYWRHKKRLQDKIIKKLHDPRNQGNRSIASGARYQPTLGTDVSNLRAAAIPSWMSTVDRGDAMHLEAMERPTVPQSDSGISGVTLNQASQFLGRG